MKGIWPIRLTRKIWVCLNRLKSFQTYLISDFLIFSIILLERIPTTRWKALKSCTSLLGYKLYLDGHVEDLRYHPPQPNHGSYSYLKFAVKPTEKYKTDDGSSTYKGFFRFKGWKGAFSILPMQWRVCILTLLLCDWLMLHVDVCENQKLCY